MNKPSEDFSCKFMTHIWAEIKLLRGLSHTPVHDPDQNILSQDYTKATELGFVASPQILSPDINLMTQIQAYSGWSNGELKEMKASFANSLSPDVLNTNLVQPVIQPPVI